MPVANYPSSSQKLTSTLSDTQLFPALYTTEDEPNKNIDIFIQQYIRGEYFKIHTIVKEYIQKQMNSLFGICNLVEQEESCIKNHKEHWIAFAIITHNEKSTVFIKDSLNTEEYKLRMSKLNQLIQETFNMKSTVDFIEHIDKQECKVSGSNISVAYTNLIIMMEYLKNNKSDSFENHYQNIISCSIDCSTIDFDRLIVEKGLKADFKFRLKPALQRILSALERVIEKDKNFKLEQTQLTKLAEVLESKNFSPRGEDKISLKDIIIDLFVIFKERRQIFDESAKNKIRKYFHENKTRYIEKINEFDKTLCEESRNNQVTGCLGLALNAFLNFFINIEKLISDLLTIEDIEELFKLLGDIFQQKNLEAQKLKLENELNNVKEHDELMDISYKLSNIRDQLDYFARKSEAISTIKINEFIILVGNKVENSQSIKQDIFSQVTLQRIIEIGKTIQEKDVAVAILKILNFIDLSQYTIREEEIDMILTIILPQITHDQGKLVISLSKKLKLDRNLSFYRLMHEVLIDNEVKEIRNEAFHILQLHESDISELECITSVVKLEGKCLNNAEDFLNECLHQVKNQNLLTLNCFEKLTENFLINETNLIIDEIIEQDIQKLPQFFIEKFIRYAELNFNNTENQLSILNLGRSLLKGQYIHFSQLQDLIKRLINDGKINSHIFDILCFVIKSQQSIPINIVEKLRNTVKTNEYSRNLIKLIDKIYDDIDILKNPREDLTKRKEILRKIENPTIDIIQVLQLLIKYDTELGIDCFKTLVTILPQDYIKQNIDIHLDDIMEYIVNNENVSIDDIRILVNKDRTIDFSYILNFIIYRIEIDQTEALTFLNEISDLKIQRELNDSQVIFLLETAFDSTDAEFRKKIVNILDNIMINDKSKRLNIVKKTTIAGTEISCSLMEELNKLRTLEKSIETYEDLTKFIKITEEEGYSITDDHVKFLIDNLAETDKDKLHEQISDILLKIYFQQDFNDTNSNTIFTIIEKNPKLFAIESIAGIVALGFARNIEISNNIVNGLLCQLKKDVENRTLKYNLIYALKVIVIQQNRISNEILEIITNYMINQDVNEEIRLAIVDIIFNVIENNNEFNLSCNINEKLKIVALQPMKNYNEHQLNKIVFRTLKRSIEENDSSHSFLSKYYELFKQRLANVEKYSTTDEIKVLDQYMHKKDNALGKFRMMNALNNTYLGLQKFDTSIYSDFSENEWEREVLCNNLLASTFLELEEHEGVDEFQLYTFRQNINSLIVLLINEHNLIEDILQELIDKQVFYHMNIEIINEILTILLQSSKDSFQILRQKSIHFYYDLKRLWLGERLKHFNIQYSMENLEKLYSCLPYEIETINSVLGKTEEGIVIEELINFFNDLSSSGFTQKSIENFLITDIPHKSSMSTWKYILTDELVGSFVSRKFPTYKNYLNQTQPEFDQIKLTLNPYNQTTTTYSYTADDLSKLTSEWMKEFITTFRLIQPLSQQDKKSLYIILGDILNEYKKDKKTTIIPLNIESDHWIVLSIVNHKNKDIALYKDSLGNSYIRQREDIIRILINHIENVDVKVHGSCEQSDDYNSGVFVLANMKIMAAQLTNKRDDFIRNFEIFRFVTKKDALLHRTQTFPEAYALNLYQSYKKRKIIEHHSNELETIREILIEKSSLGNDFKLSIDLENRFENNNYRYLYVIKVNQEIDFTYNNELKSKILEILGVNEVYLIEKNKLVLSDENCTVISNRKQKLDLTKLIIEMNDSNIDELLSELSVEITKSNRDSLKKNLGIPLRKDSAEQHEQLLNVEDHELLVRLHAKFTKIVVNGWSLKSIQEMIENIDSEENLKHLLNALDPIFEYGLKEYDKNLKGNHVFEILKHSSAKNWIKEIHELAIFQTFQGTFDKALEELKNELFDLNKHNRISFLCDDKLIGAYKNILNIYNSKSKLFDNFTTIENWTSKEIKIWAQKVKQTPNLVSQHEKLAVIRRGIEIMSKLSPREIQLLSVLILVNPEENTGRLSQINTGEGKTTIIGMLAALKALDGHQVDVITSSPELARPQAKQQQPFFELFGLTVSHNGKDGSTTEVNYQANIVYGAAGDFQGDILRDEYSKLGTRSGRKCDVAIVDEVDSMLIDGKNHIVMLSSSMPAMDYLEPVLAAIWIQMDVVAKSIKDIDGKTYIVEQDNIFDENGKVKANVVEHLIPIEDTKENFIKKCTEKHIRKLLRDKENLSVEEREIPSAYPEIKIPIHLRDLVIKNQLKKWIDSAMHAKYRCENNKHYIIKNRLIVPVDASNTGVVQQNMHWSNGLHQFLQIKHGAKMTSESLNTNFISNVTYFKRYKQNIYGLTGTLGSIGARKLLINTYSVDCVIIPPFRQKQHKELTPIVVRNSADEWFNSIVESCMNKLTNGRGVLVITKYIREVDELRTRLILAGCEDSKIKVYKTEENSMITEKSLKPGEIIIATNIAGRGTDIKANEIELNGGLHVCVSFLPPNERVEQQNVGRTSRTGNKGTSQFILLEKSKFQFNDLRKIRNLNEEDDLKHAEIKIKKVLINDAIFAEFCKLISEIDDKNDLFIKHKLRAVEERFSIWLKLQEDNIEKIANKEKILDEFKQFRMKILDDRSQSKLIQNPYYHVLIGNQLLEMKRYVEAIEEFSRAIKLDKDFQVNAYYNRGYARLAAYGSSAKRYSEEIDKAISDFKEAKKVIDDNLEPTLHIIQKASSSEALSEQVLHKMTLFGMQKNTIEMAIGADVNKEIERFENQKKLPGISQTDIDNIDQQIKTLHESKSEREKGVIRLTLNKGYDLEVELLEIEKSLPEDQDVSLYQAEILEYKNNGFIGCFQLKEIKPIDWLSVVGLMTLGLVQIVAGGALAVFTLGAGSSFGMGLILEGVSDIITAVKDGIINRDFSWAQYGIQKAISLTVSIVCAGLGAMKDVAKTAAAGAKQVGSIVTNAATETVKAGWKLAAKAIGTEIGKGIAKEVVTQLVDYGVSKVLIPSIKEEIMKQVEEPIQKALLNNPIVEKMLQLDGFNRNNYYQSLIKRKALELLSPKNKSQHALITISKGIAKGIATNKISGLSTILQIKEALEALDELKKFLPEFIKSLNEAIDEISEKENVSKKFEDLEKKQQLDEQSHVTTEQSEIKEETDSIYSLNYTQEHPVEDINLELVENQEEQILLERKSKSPDALQQDLARSVAVNMCNIIQSKLITPLTNAGINFGMKKLTAGIDKSIQDQIGNYQAERRIEFFQDNDRDNRIPDEFKQGLKNSQARAKANEMINDLKNNGQAGLPHLGAASDAIGRPIKVLDENGKVVRIIGTDKGGEPVEVEYHKPNVENPQGHWTLRGGAEPTSNDTGKNNCLFNVLAHQTGKDPNELRANTAMRMENNRENLANQASDIMRLEHYKKEALTMGGVRLIGNKLSFNDDEVQNIIQSVKGEGYKERQDCPTDFQVIDATDDQGNPIQVSRHHMIPEDEIRKGIVDLVNQYGDNHQGLKRELENFINHASSETERKTFIKALGLDTQNERTDIPDMVSSTFLNVVSWYNNNFRIGPEGTLRKNDPEKLKNKSRIDYEVADPESKKLLRRYENSKNQPIRHNILKTLVTLPNNPTHYGWTRERRKGLFEVDTNIKIAKLPKLFKKNRDDRRRFNLCKPRGGSDFTN